MRKTERCIVRGRQRSARYTSISDSPMDQCGCGGVYALSRATPFITSGRGSRTGVKFKYEVSTPGAAGGRHYDGESVEVCGNEVWIVQNGEKRKKIKTDRRVRRYRYFFVELRYYLVIICRCKHDNNV